MKKLLFIGLFSLLICNHGFSQFVGTLAGYPLVTTGWNYGGFATVVDSTIQLTTPGTDENGYVYFDSATNLTSCAQFSVKFDYRIIPPTGGAGVADGIAFFYIATPPSGFITGGGLGLPNPLTGMVFTLDTWDNDGDGLNPESELFGYPTPLTYSEADYTHLITTINPHLTFMDDATWHHCEIDYNAGNITVYYDYSIIPGMTGFYLISIPTGYFGFSSSTGAGYSIQSVKNVHITATGISFPPTVVSPVTYCQYSTASPLTATGTGPFHWYTTDTATVVSLPGGFVPSTLVAGSTTYFVRQGVGACISQPDSVTIVVIPRPPAPVITGITTYCSGDTPTPFTVSGATGTVLWYTTGTGGTGSTTPTVISTATAGLTTYYVSQIAGGCESLRDSITVKVIGTPAPPVVTGTSTYCQFVTYVAPTAAGTNVLWYTAATGGAGTATAGIVNTSIPGTTTFYVTQSDSGCTSARGPFPITVNPQPPVPAIIDSPWSYCPGQPFQAFTVISGTGVLWYTAATGGAGNSVAPIINTTIPGSDTVWATQTILGCESNRVPIVVTVHNNVGAGFTYQKKWGCKADTVVFTNTSTGTTQYLWAFGDGSTSMLADPTHIYLFQALDTVILTSMSPYCQTTDTQVIDLVHPLHAQFAADTNLICQGGSIAFTDNSYGKTGTTLSYLWIFGDGGTAGLANPSHNFPHTGIYDVKEIVSDFVPCYDTAYKTINVDTISPIYMAATDTVLCQGNEVTFTGLYSGIGNTGITWSISNNDSIKNINPLTYGFETQGTYIITATALYRVCPDTSVSRTVIVRQQPLINLGPDTAICKGSVALILADKINANTPGASWLWNTGQTTSSITVAEPGTYTGTVWLHGCTASGSVKVTNDCYMNIPNVFTPNGDGLNDYFYPRSLLSSGLLSFKMNIYNRWGQMIFETTSTEGAGWDGRFNNTEQPEGVYVYNIDCTFKDGQHEHHQGNVTLIR